MPPAMPMPLVPPSTLHEAYRAADAARWAVSHDALSHALGRALTSRFGGTEGTGAAAHAFVMSLHLADLALACACADGHSEAWDHFVLTYRPELYRAGRAIAGDAAGRDLADSLYADLFGLTENESGRRSLFRYYHGRAKLSTWLRSVLAQRHVDILRAARRTTSLDDPAQPADAVLPVTPAEPPMRARTMRLAAEAVTSALAVLSTDDRTRLAYYYAHNLTLAHTGRLFGESEATASRKLERARKALRNGIEESLKTLGLFTSDVDDWLAVAREAWDAALVDALGVAAPQDHRPAPFKGRKPS